MHSIAVAIFIVSYVGIAIGTIPGLALDRTGIALLGAIAMIGFGVVTTGEAINSIDFPTILLLYSLMVISSQFRLGGFYTHIALKITRLMDNPMQFLFTLMAASAFLSAILTNDVICLAFTPVLAVSLLNAGYNPVPFLIGLAVSSNIGSAVTIIGNPQNMLIGQTGSWISVIFLSGVSLRQSSPFWVLLSSLPSCIGRSSIQTVRRISCHRIYGPSSTGIRVPRES
jgi:Na+/H+ antiporter NhaD/arsenite permease-like protein